ncbi:MAG: GNAT family N-acetyltransferase [Candidatus Nanohalobium sp.]
MRTVAEIGIWIHPDYHGNGFGTEASELLVKYAFDHRNYHKIVARAIESNTGSQKIWEKLGFQKEGEQREEMYRDGKHRDVYYYGLIEHERN